ncbi:MAG: GreA/GreB family elongation factor [Candidatus Marinarcus sp.]|uniref:GreA/GreB family elongation factor n=1 Tax=Candidatus Marinarcus sp. TaxID=3100987 RepID=UPI003B005EF8
MTKELITEVGFQKFVDEFHHLLKVEKPFWIKEKEIAAAFGDRSENAEYISAKEMLRNLDKRLRFLQKIIDNSEVIDTNSLKHTHVNFGSEVVLLNLESYTEQKFVIVGTYESNPTLNKISNKSPLGRVLLGKKLNEEFEFIINKEHYEYKVTSVRKALLI